MGGQFEVFNPIEHIQTHLNIIGVRLNELLPVPTYEEIVNSLNELVHTHQWKYIDRVFFLINGNYKNDDGSDLVERRISSTNLDLKGIDLPLAYKIILFFVFNYEQIDE